MRDLIVARTARYRRRSSPAASSAWPRTTSVPIASLDAQRQHLPAGRDEGCAEGDACVPVREGAVAAEAEEARRQALSKH